jgi:ABC-type antimicrobial peptide transport system permease subunit
MDTEVNGHPLQIFPNWVDPEFFRAMDVPILLGRNFIPGEKHVVLVSQSMARRMWPGENPIGKTYGDKDTVIGVVGNARMNDMNEDDTVELYWPVQPEDMAGMCLVLKTSGAPDGLTVALKAIVQNLDPKLFPEISLLKANFRSEMKSIEIAALVVSLVGMLAMLLAGIGILGLVAYTVSQRTREIGIRMALGAQRNALTGLFVRQGLGLTAIGAACGLVVAFVTMRLMSSILFNVSPADPLTYIVITACVGATACLACYLPSRRAATVNPVNALRSE